MAGILYFGKLSYLITILTLQIELDYESTIRRIKVISLSQSTFLKAYLHQKLIVAKELVQKLLDFIKQSAIKNEGYVKDIASKLKDLKLGDIEVDVNASKALLSDELSTLKRTMVEITSASAKAPDVEERVKNLEKENTNLRKLLEQAKSEISRLSTAAVSPAPAILQGDANAEILAKLKTELGELKLHSSKHQADISDKGNHISVLSKEIDQLRKSLKECEDSKISELNSQRKDFDLKLKNVAVEAEERLKRKVREMNESADERLKEAQLKLEMEKDEMMEALSQEVEVSKCN